MHMVRTTTTTSQVAFVGVSMRWSVLSRVRVIADPAGSSLHGRGLPVDADLGWMSRLSRCSAEHECTPSTDTHGEMASVFGAHAGFDSGYMRASVFGGAVWANFPLFPT